MHGIAVRFGVNVQFCDVVRVWREGEFYWLHELHRLTVLGVLLVDYID